MTDTSEGATAWYEMSIALGSFEIVLQVYFRKVLEEIRGNYRFFWNIKNTFLKYLKEIVNLLQKKKKIKI